MKRTNSKRVQVVLNGKTMEFDSLTEAAVSLNFSYSSMCNWIKGRMKPANGIIIKYIDE